MTDPRYKKLAKLLVEYSIRLVKRDRALLDMIDVPDDFSIELMRAVRAAGATPVIEVRHTRINREMLRETDCENAGLMRDLELFRLRKVQAYIA
ncbi:MAG: aminopeptidase, partial [Verrucomicrobia bacterium]|nr:aminopeptidase [Verrucomicrobiota bacterium]